MTDNLDEKNDNLSPEEIEELSSIFENGMDSIINPSGRSSAVSHDLAKEDSSLGFNQSAVDLVNERFARQIRMGLIEVLRTTPRITTNKLQIKTFGECTAGLKAPLAISTVRMDPLRGMSLVIIEPKIIFSALDSFFGGFGKSLEKLAATRIFTPTEDTIIGLLMNIILASLKEAWSPIIHVDFQKIGQEVNPAFAQIADDNELMVQSRFDFTIGQNETGFIQIIQPFSLLKPIREQLRSRIQTNDDEDEQSTRWMNDLRDACEDIKLEASVKVGDLELLFSELLSLKKNQVIKFDYFDRAKISVGGKLLFLGEVGQIEDNIAVKLIGSTKD